MLVRKHVLYYFSILVIYINNSLHITETVELQICYVITLPYINSTVHYIIVSDRNYEN